MNEYQIRGVEFCKTQKYGIDLDAYDHTDVMNRPAVLIKHYK